MSKTNNVGGFTLLEMLVVMVLIASIAAFAVIRVGGGIDNFKLRSVVRSCSAVMRYARSIAVSTQKEYKISFILEDDPEKKDYYTYHKVSRASGNEDKDIEDITDEYEEGQREKTELKWENESEYLDPKISLSWRSSPDSDWEEEGQHEISFFPRGSASGGEIRFALSDDGRFYILNIDRVTGRVKISTEKE